MSLTITRIEEKVRPKSEAVALALFSGEKVDRHPFFSLLSPSNQRYLKTFVSKGFAGEKDEVDFVIFPSGKPSAAFFVGLGKRKEWSRRRQHLFFRRLVTIADQQKIASLALHVRPILVDGEAEAEAVRQAAENLLLARYQYRAYQKTSPKKRQLARVELMSGVSGDSRALREGITVASYTNVCRDLANTPGGDMTPSLLAEKAKAIAKEAGLHIRVLGREEMKQERMGAILGVARGSTEEPKFLILEYHGGAKSDAPIVFVGKGVTFDSGGINLKPEKGLKEMHMDMSGGAAAIAAIAAVSKLKFPVNVVALVPAVENMPSGSGYRPGDVLRSRSGKTIEIGNTDAEGRVILADALDFAKQYKPQLVVDVATLTGAAMAALGLHRNALFTPDSVFAMKLADRADRAGDPVWPLPLGEEYSAEVKGSIGDISNTGKHHYGDAIHGAVFLQAFAGRMPWVHLDIAPMMTSTEGQFLAPGASGTGVRFLVAVAEEMAKTKLRVSSEELRL